MSVLSPVSPIPYHRLWLQANNKLEVEVISAFTLDNEMRNSLQQVIEKKLGHEVEIFYQQQPSLLGGVVIRSDDWVIDDSVKTKLMRLKQSLMS